MTPPGNRTEDPVLRDPVLQDPVLRDPVFQDLDGARGIAAVLGQVVRAQGCSEEVASWICLSDYPQVRSLLRLDAATGDGPESGVAQVFRAELHRSADLGTAYCAAVPAAQRRRLGEHYTPGWLVRRMAEPFVGGGTVADPACGDGRFLSTLIRLGHPDDRIWGVDLNPLAVMMSRYHAWVAAGCRDRPACRIEWSDFLLGDHHPGMAGNADLPCPETFIGNPPWVTWRTIPQAYRRHLTARWRGSSLHTLRGWDARVAAGQTDLSHLFLHEAIERVSPHGRVCFVLPRSTFQGPVGSAPIRSGTASSGRVYGYQEIWEIDTAEAFGEVRGEPVVARLAVDAPQRFPVPWHEIRRSAPEPIATHHAHPAAEDDRGSSWVTRGGVRPLRLAPGQRPAVLRARGGINTGGANSVFHLRVLHRSESGLTVENLRSRRAAGDIEVVRADIEPDFVRPLLRGREITPWRAAPRDAILVPHDPADLRRVVPGGTLRTQAAQTWRYLQHFEGCLRNRKELARWGGAWYTLFRIGRYTAGCWRVVWPHSGGPRLRAAVLTPDDPTVPDQKVVLLAFESADQALFYCALLNSEPVRQLVRGSCGLDASPNLVRRIVLPELDVTDPGHAAVLDYARAAIRRPAQAEGTQSRLDALVWALYV